MQYDIREIFYKNTNPEPNTFHINPTTNPLESAKQFPGIKKVYKKKYPSYFLKCFLENPLDQEG